MAKELKKVIIWFCVESSDGYGSVTWFLNEGTAENYNSGLSIQLSDNIHSAETFIGSDIHKEAEKNEEKYAQKEWYEDKDNYYESRSVGTRAKSDKSCIVCGKTIKMGTPHKTHHFYPEFSSVTTHEGCVKKFMENLK